MSKPDLNCSFCGRPKPETQLLIAGLDAHICDRCIIQAHGIILEESSEENKDDDLSLDLKTPIEIKTFLDDYVIGQEVSKGFYQSRFIIIINDCFRINPRQIM